MKKILFLGGATQQMPAIKYAKNKGYYTILCDYLSDNPGQYVCDKFYCISTTDKYSVLNISKENNIDGIVAYASDPAALTAAYVANKLNLPSNPYDSVEILSKKNLFRKFLKQNNFNCPKSESYQSYEEALSNIKNFNFPLMIKPVDSSGSKGITKINKTIELYDAFLKAINTSREHLVIIEEFIESSHDYMIGGDAFIFDGKVQFWGILNSHRNININPFVPIGTSYPSFLNEYQINKVKVEVQKIVDILHLKSGALNLELMFDKNDKLYIIEIGPRNGGNMIPDLLKITTGVDLIAATVESSLGNTPILHENNPSSKYYSTYVIHTNQNGFLKEICFSEQIKNNILNEIIYKHPGDEILQFNSSNCALGILFLKFNDLTELITKMNKIYTLINVMVI